MKSIKPFHISLPVKEFEHTKAFYADFLGGKLSDKGNYINIELFGHQLTFHENREMKLVDMPEFHWGFNLSWDEFEMLAKKAEENPKVQLILKPAIKDEGTKSERIKMFLKDPSGYQIEIKEFK